MRKKINIVAILLLASSLLVGCSFTEKLKELAGIQWQQENNAEAYEEAAEEIPEEEPAEEPEAVEEEQEEVISTVEIPEEVPLIDEEELEEAAEEEDEFADIDTNRLIYSCNRECFESDQAFANFRSLKGGELRENVFYRSASPVFNQYARAPFADTLAQKAGINCVLNLSDSNEEIKQYMEENGGVSPYYQILFSTGKVIPVNLTNDYYTNEFAFALADGIKKMTRMHGPVLIHCFEGKGRTGFVCMLFEAIAGASYEEIERDYMLTYENYLDINLLTDEKYYRYIKQHYFDKMVRQMALADEDVDTREIDLYASARQYLYNAGLSEEELDRLEVYLRK